ncbi:MAG TPA: AAA family ATPase, partial [Candidatus Polarisedimenticolia bacterium]|nr:AAA family ATPase [Candidatus Polarisedimenticolia bacterium]
MIRCLQISNLAIIREATLDLAPGLNLLTGETGAGKSILVDALSVVLGGRAGAEMIRAGAERASVAAVLDVGSSPSAAAFLAGKGYETEGGTLVAR